MSIAICKPSKIAYFASSVNLYSFTKSQTKARIALEAILAFAMLSMLVGQHPKPFEPAIPGCGPMALFVVVFCSDSPEDKTEHRFQYFDGSAFQAGSFADFVHDFICTVIDLFFSGQLILGIGFLYDLGDPLYGNCRCRLTAFGKSRIRFFPLDPCFCFLQNGRRQGR